MPDIQRSAFQPTPGPWKVGGEWATQFAIYDDRCIYLALAETGVGRDWIGVNPIGRDCAKANAHLMAAAPDLLAVLKKLRALVADHPALQHREYVALGIEVNAAIAKAEGA